MSKELPQNERIFRDPGRLTAFRAVATRTGRSSVVSRLGRCSRDLGLKGGQWARSLLSLGNRTQMPHTGTCTIHSGPIRS
jgi:hypothetical protein